MTQTRCNVTSVIIGAFLIALAVTLIHIFIAGLILGDASLFDRASGFATGVIASIILIAAGFMLIQLGLEGY